MKHTHIPTLLGLLPLIGLTGCGMLGERTPEVTNAARLNVAMAAEASGDSQMALQLYAAALAKDPSNVQATVQYARALVNNRQVGLARELLSRQLATRPGQPDLSREFGTIEVLQGQPASALPRFDTALLANPSDVRAMVNKGIALDMLGRHVEAQQLYRQADLLSPDDPAVRSNLAMSLMLSGQSAQASEIMQNNPGVASDSPRIRNNMAVLAAANGDMARARQLSGGDISDAELRALAAQLRSLPPEPIAPAPALPASVPVAAAAPVVAPVAVPAAAPPADAGVAGALPLTVPGEGSSPATPRVTPARAQDKRGAARLNMTQVTPALIARALEQAVEKEAAYIGEAPSAMRGPALADQIRIAPAIAASPLRVHPAMAGGVTQSATSAAMSSARPAEGPRMGYAVQLATVETEAGAQYEWRVLNSRLPFMMMGREALIDHGARADGRVYWRLRTPGFAEYGAARQFCDDLKLAGRDCFVTGGRSQQATVRLPAAEPMPATPTDAAARPDPV